MIDTYITIINHYQPFRPLAIICLVGGFKNQDLDNDDIGRWPSLMMVEPNHELPLFGWLHVHTMTTFNLGGYNDYEAIPGKR